MTREPGIGDSMPRWGAAALLLLGLCPALAVSVRVIDALWMSAGVFAVLLLSSLCMSLLARARGQAEGSHDDGLPGGRWISALAISSFLTASFEALLLAGFPAASADLGIYAPLIAVNCLVLGRGAIGGQKGSMVRVLTTAAGRGAAFAGCLVLLAIVRESLGAGTITLFPAGGFSGTLAVPGLIDQPARAMGLAGGGLLCLGYLAALAQVIAHRAAGKRGSRKGQT